jgi:hypothetical protein
MAEDRRLSGREADRLMADLELDAHLRQLDGPDLDRACQEAAERRLSACEAALLEIPLDELEDSESAEIERISAPFDGCQTCVVREVLDASMVFVKEMMRRQLERG